MLKVSERHVRWIRESTAGQAEVHQQGVVDEVCGSQARVATVQKAQLGELTGRKHVTAEEDRAVTSVVVRTIQPAEFVVAVWTVVSSSVAQVRGMDTDHRTAAAIVSSACVAATVSLVHMARAVDLVVATNEDGQANSASWTPEVGVGALIV